MHIKGSPDVSHSSILTMHFSHKFIEKCPIRRMMPPVVAYLLAQVCRERERTDVNVPLRQLRRHKALVTVENAIGFHLVCFLKYC